LREYGLPLKPLYKQWEYTKPKPPSFIQTWLMCVLVLLSLW